MVMFIYTVAAECTEEDIAFETRAQARHYFDDQLRERIESDRKFFTQTPGFRSYPQLDEVLEGMRRFTEIAQLGEVLEACLGNQMRLICCSVIKKIPVADFTDDWRRRRDLAYETERLWKLAEASRKLS